MTWCPARFDQATGRALHLEPTGAFGTSAAPPVQLEASNGRCWDTPELRFTSLRDGKLKDKGSPSGAFLD
jgi:hypothetical protein